MKCMNCRKEAGQYLYCKKCDAERTQFKAPTVIFKGKDWAGKQNNNGQNIY